MALVAIVICSLIAVPTLKYAMTVIHSSQIVSDKTIRQEAVKGGLRVALADPVKLFEACKNAGPDIGFGQSLASPGLSSSVTTTCYKMTDVTAEDPATLRSARATVQVGATAPAATGLTGIYPGVTYPGNISDGNAWLVDATKQSTFNKIWLPDLPAHGLNFRTSTPFTMPAGYVNPGFTACTVYFPGTYTAPLTITSATPVLFTSGIYYFENVVKISGNAKVVVGDGATDGCTTDQKAAFNATNAPLTHNITGIGATFVLGASGSLVVDNTTAGTPSIVFNRRYVSANDPATATSAGVSILSVNGQISASGPEDLLIANQLHVPLSQVAGSSSGSAVDQEYAVSTLTPPAPPAVPTNPIIDIEMTLTTTMTVSIPGYIAVPQGTVKVNATTPANAANKTVTFGGGILAAQMLISAATPSQKFLFGIDNPYTQKIFKIVSTSAGAPLVTSTAIVQVNANGAYAVNSWSVQ